MNKQQIREIIENEINLRDATPDQVNKSVNLILASHLRSQIELLTEYKKLTHEPHI